MLGRFFGGLTGKAKEDFGHGNALFVPYMNVYKNVVAAPNACEQVEVRVGETQNKIVAGDIMFTQSSETVEEIGFASVWLSNHTPYLNSFCFAFRIADQTSILPLWFAYFMRSANVRKTIMREGQGITRVNLSSERMKAIALAIPCESEQQKIAAVLSLLDSKITAQRKLVKLLKKHKRGLSNGIFSGKIRLVKSGEWRTYRLAELVRRVTRKNGKTSDVPLTISAQYGLIDQREFFSKSVASADMSGYYLLKRGEFAYNRSSSGEYPFGSIKRLERYTQGTVSTLYLCFEAKGDEDDAAFLKWYFDSFAWHREVGMICAEGARNHGLLNVPTDGFFDTRHRLPSDKTERSAIASLMSLAEAQCVCAEAELTRLTELKSGLLQQMFV